MQKLLYIDFETFSEVDLRSRGVYAYMRGVLWGALIMTYRWGADGTTQIAIGHDEMLEALAGVHEDTSVTFVAHNANFERLVLSNLFGYPDWEFIAPERFIDTMAMGRALGLPGPLANLAKALGVSDKDSAGTRLINMFCTPDRNGKFYTPAQKPVDWEAFCNYAIQDIDTMVEAHQAMEARFGGMPVGEWAVWCADQRINDRGVLADVALANRCVDIAARLKGAAIRQMEELSGMDNANSTQQFLTWMCSELQNVGLVYQAGDGYHYSDSNEPLASVDKKSVEYLLSRDDLPVKVRQVLELRQMSNAASVAKFNAIIKRANNDSRIRGVFQYFGAHTGRWAGRAVQLQNLPSVTVGDDEATEARAQRLLTESFDNFTMADMKPMIRGALMAPEGQTLTVCDYSAIEARVLAWLAGEEWVLEAFRAGRDIYVETASRMFGVDYEAAKALRKKGKVAVLALGYNGGVGSLRAMGAEGTDEELQELVYTYRSANPHISMFWKQLEYAFRVGYGKVGKYITVQTGKGGQTEIVLPSGRPVVYHDVHTRPMMKFEKVFDVLHFRDPKGWDAWVATYGGKLTENITQATARDVLANALVQLDKEGAEVVAHVHDEVICQGNISVERLAELMGSNGSEYAPGWAEGLPLAAEGYYCKRYRKE